MKHISQSTTTLHASTSVMRSQHMAYCGISWETDLVTHLLKLNIIFKGKQVKERLTHSFSHTSLGRTNKLVWLTDVVLLCFEEWNIMQRESYLHETNRQTKGI